MSFVVQIAFGDGSMRRGGRRWRRGINLGLKNPVECLVKFLFLLKSPHNSTFIFIGKINNVAVWISRVYMINSIINNLWAIYPRFHLKQNFYRKKKKNTFLLLLSFNCYGCSCYGRLVSYFFVLNIADVDREICVYSHLHFQVLLDDILDLSMDFYMENMRR